MLPFSKVIESMKDIIVLSSKQSAIITVLRGAQEMKVIV